MRKDGRWWILVMAVVTVCAGMVPAGASAAMFGAEVLGAYNRYSMDDVNNFIADENATNSTTFEELNGGVTAVLGLRTWANENWLMSASWEPLRLQTESGTTTLNVDANSFQFTAAHFFPSTTKARYGIGAGLGYYSISGSFEDSSTPGSLGSIEGTGLGFHALGLGEWPVNESFALTGSAGYRIADVEIKDDADGNTANYSGVMARVGFAFYMPNK